MQALFGSQILNLRYYEFTQTDLEGIPLVVARTGWTAELGYELYLRDGSRGEELWERIMEAGKPFGIAPTGPSDIRRIEAGILNYGAGMTLQNNPFEVGLGWLVDLDQSEDFIGRKALERIHRESVRRKLVGIELAGEPIEFNTTKWPVASDGKQISHVTSAIYSPRLRKNVGFAMIPIAQSEHGTSLTSSLPGVGMRTVTVVPMPFVDPSKQIPKA